jgi:hypothetical protein
MKTYIECETTISYMCVYAYIYIYIYGERERERKAVVAVLNEKLGANFC